MRVSPARENYLCAKGRFGWDAVHHADRLTTPKMRVGGELVDCTWDEALAVIATNLKVIKNKRGADSIGGLGSVRTTNEDNYVFQKFMRAVIGTNNVDTLARLKAPRGLNTAFFSGELSRMGGHEVILMLDKDAGEINPLTGIEVVRAVNKKGRNLILVNGGYNKFNKIASVVLDYNTPGGRPRGTAPGDVLGDRQRRDKEGGGDAQGRGERCPHRAGLPDGQGICADQGVRFAAQERHLLSSRAKGATSRAPSTWGAPRTTIPGTRRRTPRPRLPLPRPGTPSCPRRPG